MKNSDPCLVTIGLSVYNCEKYIESTLNSIFNQTYSNWRLIVINDGSTDDSDLIIKKYVHDWRVTYINDLNKGLISQLNRLIELTTTEFFVRMDGDDIMTPDRIERQVNYLLKNRHVDVLGGSAISIDENDEIIGLRDCGNNFNITTILKKGIAFIHPTVMGKTSWFKKNSYAPGFDRAEDLELWLRTTDSSCFFNLKEPCLFYREGRVNLTNYIESGKTLFKIYKNYRPFFKSGEYYKVVFLRYVKVFLYRFFTFIGKQNYLADRRSAPLGNLEKYKRLLQISKNNNI